MWSRDVCIKFILAFSLANIGTPLGSGAVLLKGGWRLWQQIGRHCVVYLVLHHCDIHLHQCLYW